MADQAAEKIQQAAARVAAEAEPAADKAADKLVATGKDISAKGPKVRLVVEPSCVCVSAAAQLVLQLQSSYTALKWQARCSFLILSMSCTPPCTAVLYDPAAGTARHSCLHESDLKILQSNAQVMGLAMLPMPCCLHRCTV